MSEALVGAIDVAAAAGQLRAVAYLRVSTEEQKKGYGIDYTGRKVRNHVAKKGWRLVDVFSDEGFNGSLLWNERPDLKRLMEQARTTPRPFDVVAVNEARAIGRKGQAFWPWVWELEKLGIFVSVVRGDYDNTDDEGRRRMRDDAGRAEDERILIRDRTQGGIQEAAEVRAGEGGYVGGQPPFGWRIENQGKKGQARYGLDGGAGGTWHTLARARELAVEYKGDIDRAATALNGRGMLTRSGKPWTRQNLQARLLSDAVLKSEVTFRDTRKVINRVKTDADGNPLYGETVVIKIPAAFSDQEIEELLDAVQVKTYGPRRGDRTYPFSGRILSMCGEQYTGCAPGKRRRRYRCMGKKPKYAGAPTCSCGQIPADELESLAWSKLARILSDPEELRIRAEEWSGMNAQANVNFEERLAQLDRDIAQKDRAIGVVMAAAAQDADSPQEAIRIATKALKDQRGELAAQRAQVAAWHEESLATQGRAEQLQHLAESAARQLVKMDLDDMAEIIGMMNVSLTLLEPVADTARSCPVTDWFRGTALDVPALTDEGWARAEPVIRARHRPDSRLPQRRILEGLLHKARLEASWPALGGFGNPQGLRAAWGRWLASGAWAEAIALLDGEGARPVPSRLPRLRMKAEIIDGLILSTERDSITCGPTEACDRVLLRFEVTLTS